MTSKRVSIPILFIIGIAAGAGFIFWIIPAPDMPDMTGNATAATELTAPSTPAPQEEKAIPDAPVNDKALAAVQPEQQAALPPTPPADISPEPSPKPEDHPEAVADTPEPVQPETREAAAEPRNSVPRETSNLPNGWKLATFKVHGALYDSLYHALEPQGFTRTQSDIIAAHLKRLLIWKLPRLRRDVQAGDSVTMIITEDPDVSDGWRILALKYHSMKLRDTIQAFYYHPEGKRFGAFYNEDGEDIALTMTNAPVKEYEQITALLGDGRHHKGIDFKAPVGIPVYAPEKARVQRKNWRYRGNGHCLELRYVHSGVTAMFLHLDSIAPGVKVGSLVDKGEKIATVGNTGRSYAPHLHYQLEKPAGTILNPFKYHGSSNRRLRGKELAHFVATIKKYAPYMD